MKYTFTYVAVITSLHADNRGARRRSYKNILGYLFHNVFTPVYNTVLESSTVSTSVLQTYLNKAHGGWAEVAKSWPEV